MRPGSGPLLTAPHRHTGVAARAAEKAAAWFDLAAAATASAAGSNRA
jgi:hypothetical protein